MSDHENLIDKYPDLALRTFFQVLQSPTQSYKFFWLEAILDLIMENPGKSEFAFSEIMDVILWNAWKLVENSKLHLGPKVSGKYSNAIETAIESLASKTTHPEMMKQHELEKLISENPEITSKYYNAMTRYVPYRLLSPFLTKRNITEQDYKSVSKITEEIHLMFELHQVPYEIVPKKREGKFIRLDSEWKDFFHSEYSVLIDWIQGDKAAYLEKVNSDIESLEQEVKNQNKKY